MRRAIPAIVDGGGGNYVQFFFFLEKTDKNVKNADSFLLFFVGFKIEIWFVGKYFVLDFELKGNILFHMDLDPS